MEMTGDEPDRLLATNDFSDLAARASAARDDRVARENAEWEALRPQVESKRAIDLAAWGTSDLPVGKQFGPTILIESSAWAPLIIAAALSWKVHPGLAVLDDRPIPDEGLGYDAGRRIFDLAARGASVTEVTTAIDQARKALGPASVPGTRRCDSEDAILGFFRQLSRYHEGPCWSPPINRAKAAREAAIATEPTVPSTAPATPIVTPEVERSQPTPRVEAEQGTVSVNEFRRAGSTWRLTFGGVAVSVPNQKGFACLQLLIERQPRAVDLDELDAASSGGAVEGHSVRAPDPDENPDRTHAGDGARGDPTINDEGLAAIRQDIERLDREITAAKDSGNVPEQETLERKKADVLSHLRQELALYGRPREMTNDGTVRHDRVRKRIRRALARIQKEHPALHAHLIESLRDREGRAPRYDPGTVTTWMLN